MVATTEPPWLNKTVGIAARNGTSSHTITFSSFGDAPFTPTAGSLLVVEVFGGVTHAAAGWNEPLQPVNSGELSVFWVVTSGHTGITVTHNGSNYPVAVCVREYPPGSSYVSGTGNTNASDAFSALTGLTGGAGNERVLHGARGRTATNSSAVSGSSTWTGPLVEDADLFTVFASGTDGFYFTSGHQINVTATSFTPAAATVYNGGAAEEGFPADREHVTYAINAAVVSGTTPFAKDWSTTWRITNAWVKDYASTWRITNAWTRDWASTWRITNAFTKDYVTSWRVSNAWVRDWADTWRITNAWSQDWSDGWRVLGAWNRDWSDAWRIRNAWTRDWASTWVIRAAWQKDWSTDWRVFNAWQKDYASTWDLLAGSGWVRDYADTWRIRGAWQADYADSWRVFGAWQRDWVSTWRVTNLWSKDYITTWDLYANEQFVRDWSDTWRIRALFQKDWASTWRILSDTPPPPLSADVTAWLHSEITTRIIVPTITARL